MRKFAAHKPLRRDDEHFTYAPKGKPLTSPTRCGKHREFWAVIEHLNMQHVLQRELYVANDFGELVHVQFVAKLVLSD